jgi:hypothetical protein
MYDIGGLDELGRKLMGADPGAAADDELREALLSITRHDQRTQLAAARILAELERREVCDRDFGMTTATWLAREANLPPNRCRGQVATAKALTHLPVITDAVAQGTISFDHAKVIAQAANPRVRDAVAGLQDQLVELAAQARFGRWQAEVRGIIDLLDEDGGHNPDDDVARNRLRISESLDHVVQLHGELVGEYGLALAQMVETKADDLYRRYQRDKKLDPDLVIPPRAALLALALHELCRQGCGTDLTATNPPRPEVMLVINTDEPSAVYDPVGRRLPSEATRTLLCDSDFYAMVTDKLGVPFDMGRTVRLATSHQRKALAALYGGCAVPGCDCAPRWVDIHHGDDWVAKKGHTNFSRLVPLCRRHHGMTHRRGWKMRIDPDGWVWWQTPTGHTFWSQRHGRQRDHPPPEPIFDDIKTAA